MNHSVSLIREDVAALKRRIEHTDHLLAMIHEEIRSNRKEMREHITTAYTNVREDVKHQLSRFTHYVYQREARQQSLIPNHAHRLHDNDGGCRCYHYHLLCHGLSFCHVAS